MTRKTHQKCIAPVVYQPLERARGGIKGRQESDQRAGNSQSGASSGCRVASALFECSQLLPPHSTTSTTNTKRLAPHELSIHPSCLFNDIFVVQVSSAQQPTPSPSLPASCPVPDKRPTSHQDAHSSNISFLAKSSESHNLNNQFDRVSGHRRTKRSRSPRANTV